MHCCNLLRATDNTASYLYAGALLVTIVRQQVVAQTSFSCMCSCLGEPKQICKNNQYRRLHDSNDTYNDNNVVRWLF